MQGASYEELQAVELREPSWGLLLSPTDGNNLRTQMTPSLDKPTSLLVAYKCLLTCLNADQAALLFAWQNFDFVVEYVWSSVFTIAL